MLRWKFNQPKHYQHCHCHTQCTDDYCNFGAKI